MAAQKEKLLRVLEILQQTDEDHPVTATAICHQLMLYGIDAERKSVLRDIAVIRDYGYDIVACQDNKKGFFLASRRFEDWELKVLTDAVWQANFLTEKESASLVQRLGELASADSRETLRRVTPVHSHLKTTDPVVKIRIDSLLTAIRKGRQVQFQYTYTDASLTQQLAHDGKWYTVNPYSMLTQNNRYYLIANVPPHANCACFRLDKVVNLAILEEAATPAESICGPNPDRAIDEYVARSLQMHGGKSIRITLRVPEYMIDDLCDTFGSKLQFVPDGKQYRVEVDANDGNGLYYWLLQNERNLEVVAPQSVREEFVKRLNEMLKIYCQERKDEV